MRIPRLMEPYWILADGTLELVKWVFPGNYLVLPKKLEGQTITSISERAFSRCGSIIGVELPDSLVQIAVNPFQPCRKLKRILIMSGNPVFETVDGVLYNRLTKTLIACPPAWPADSLAIPQGITCVAEHAFDRCSGLTAIDIPDTVTAIGESAFMNCEALRCITVPDSVTSLGGFAFANCKALTGAVLPAGLTAIGENTFFGCLELSGLRIPEGVTAIGDGAFSFCLKLTDIALPEGVTSIGEGAFFNCRSLSRLTIPAGVTEIGEDAFSVFADGRNAPNPRLTLTVAPGSYAEEYCRERGLRFVCAAE